MSPPDGQGLAKAIPKGAIHLDNYLKVHNAIRLSVYPIAKPRH